MVGKVCALTGLRAADTCPYAVPGVIVASPDGNNNASSGWCPHSYLNGVPLFDPSALTSLPNAVTPDAGAVPGTTPDASATPDQGATDATQSILPALGGAYVPGQ